MVIKIQVTNQVNTDEYGNGVPVAFGLSEREYETTINTFLKCVFKLTGKINAKYFMSDDANQYYSAWQSVMGQAKKNLFAWHVLKNWKQQVKQKVKDSKKQELILKKLINIRNAPDKEKCEFLFNELIKELDRNKSTSDFVKYLKSYYSKRLDQWAYFSID